MSQYVYASNNAAMGVLALGDSTFFGLSGPARGRALTKREEVEGSRYLAQQWVEQSDAAAKANVKFAKPRATKTRDGKASVQITSVLTEWNREAAKALRPVAPAIRGLDLLSRSMREKLINRPIDALLDLFNPLFSTLAVPCKRTMDLHLKGGRRVEWFGQYLDIRISQPTIDIRLDVSTRNFVKKLRTIQAFIICFLKKPLEFTGECLKAGIDLATNVAKSVGKAVDSAVMSIGKAAQDAGAAVGDLAAKAADEAGKAAAGVASLVGGFLGFGSYDQEYEGLGDGGAASGPSVAGTTLICGVAIENSLILGVLASITGTVVALFKIQTDKEVQLAQIKAGGKYTKTEPDGTVTSFGPGEPPKPVAPVPEALSDLERGPPGAPPPPDVRTLQLESKAKGSEDGDAGDAGDKGGFPVLPVALAVGVVAFLMLRK